MITALRKGNPGGWSHRKKFLIVSPASMSSRLKSMWLWVPCDRTQDADVCDLLGFQASRLLPRAGGWPSLDAGRVQDGGQRAVETAVQNRGYAQAEVPVAARARREIIPPRTSCARHHRPGLRGFFRACFSCRMLPGRGTSSEVAYCPLSPEAAIPGRRSTRTKTATSPTIRYSPETDGTS